MPSDNTLIRQSPVRFFYLLIHGSTSAVYHPEFVPSFKAEWLLPESLLVSVEFLFFCSITAIIQFKITDLTNKHALHIGELIV